MTSEEHNKYIGFAFLAYAGFQLLMLGLMMAWMYFIFSTIPSRPGDDPFPATDFFGFFFAFMFIFQMIFTAPAVIASYGVFYKKKWARMASIVAAVISAMSVPVGTGAAVYALWFFFGDRWKEVYENPSEMPYSGSLGLNDASDWQPADSERVRDRQYEPKPGDWR